MHYKYYVLVKQADADTSAEARRQAGRILDQNLFVQPEENGYFCNSKADWYVIGGRWSGDLSALLYYPEFYRDVEKQFAKETTFGITDKELKKNNKKIQALWESKAPKGLPHPYARDRYSDIGREDDAMQLTPELVEALDKEAIENKDLEIFIDDIQEEKLMWDFLGDFNTEDYARDWIVVIDYHN